MVLIFKANGKIDVQALEEDVRRIKEAEEQKKGY